MDTEHLYMQAGGKNIKEFSAKLIPNCDYPIYGVRIPELRKIAKTLDDTDFEIKYHEDVLLRGFIIASRKIGVREKLELLSGHLDYLATWDETDTLASSLKFGKKEIDIAYEYFAGLLEDSRLYARRLAVVWIMSNRAKVSADLEEQLDLLVKVRTDDGYYIEMALAWALSFYYISDRKICTPYMEMVSENVKKMAMQKIRDSRRT